MFNQTAAEAFYKSMVLINAINTITLISQNSKATRDNRINLFKSSFYLFI